NFEPEIDFTRIMDRVQRVIETIEPHDSVERYSELGVDCVQGTAELMSPYEVLVTEEDDQGGVSTRTLTAKNIIIATGARPYIPDIPGLLESRYLTSDTVWNLREAPKKMTILGGGPIGCELSQAFARLGIEVTQIERNDRIMKREDIEVSDFVSAQLRQEGVELLTRHHVIRVESNGDDQRIVCEADGKEVEIQCDCILVAVGRQANTSGLGLEKLGIDTTAQGLISSNDYLQTFKYPNIYACGDVAGPYQFTHAAAHQAWYAAVNSLFGFIKRFKVDYRIMPWATFVDPEVARVGMNEQELKAAGIDYQLTQYGIGDLDRAIADGETTGFVRVFTQGRSDKILGVTIVGSHAAELLSEFILAMKHDLGMNKILGTIHSYPTWSEANKFAAGEWKKANAPQKVLAWLEKFHRWRRS
ncbi:MAG: FAD-dependent oxidoreductase, partial [Pseudomonadota bacterium]